MKHDPHFRPKEKALTFSKLPKSLRERFASVQSRIQWTGITLDRGLIHIGFMGGGCEYWKKHGRTWQYLMGGYPIGSDLPSLLRDVA